MDVLLATWLFVMLIGGWLLANALIDLGARRTRHWLMERWRRLVAIRRSGIATRRDSSSPTLPSG